MPDYKFLYSQGYIANWYLRDYQQGLYNKLLTGKDIITNCHRRFGKDSVVLTYCSEQATRNPRDVIRYGAPTMKQAYEISDYILTKIYSKYPKCKPAFRDRGGFWEYPSSGQMFIFGGKDKNEVEKGRGVEAKTIVLSEYGFFKFRPEYLVKDVLGPQLDTTNGQRIIVSTVPEDLTHYYVELLNQSSKYGESFEWDIRDSWRVKARSFDQIKRIIKRCGGVKSDSFQREYLCRLIPSQGRLIVPEAQDERLYVGEIERPEFYDSYVGIDLGLKDFSVALFGYYHFVKNMLVIEQEYACNYTTTEQKVGVYKMIESDLGFNPYKRISDNDLQQLYDMNNTYNYHVTPVVKRRKGSYNPQDNTSLAESLINQLRIELKQGKVLISPRCKTLISSLKYGIWNEKRTDFERNDQLGHWDAGITLCYLLDNIDKNRNPYPEIPVRLHKKLQEKPQEVFYRPNPKKTIRDIY